MTKILIAIAMMLGLTACQSTEAAATKPAPILVPAPNHVCERIAIANKDAKCAAEMTDVGEHHVHSARVTVGDVTVACALNDQSITVTCGALILDPAPPQQAQQATQPPAAGKSTKSPAK